MECFETTDRHLALPLYKDFNRNNDETVEMIMYSNVEDENVENDGEKVEGEMIDKVKDKEDEFCVKNEENPVNKRIQDEEVN